MMQPHPSPSLLQARFSCHMMAEQAEGTAAVLLMIGATSLGSKLLSALIWCAWFCAARGAGVDLTLWQFV